ncbi:amidohydrolase [Pelomonas sp. CA6]|uniref:amidohydrolase family protein n=1 Tax=Pelomonas sp. CA6 TaxID=2907999 RepID=UPI001F4BB259|nr:amidohydrolase family protein [Pelomonas sp. CA6]MCH7342740.1 amidohydrolase [Pelomonas sp. CA6]
MQRRHLLCCGAAAAGALFTGLMAGGRALAAAGPECAASTLPPALREHALLARCWEGLDPGQLWDVHTHLLGTGDSGSGCRIDPRMTQWWHPVESLRRRVILRGACVAEDAPSIDRAYVQRLLQLAADFPEGARWMLYAFDEALDESGRPRPDWTCFHVPDHHAAGVAARHAQRFAWVASIHPLREDALARLDAALAGGAVALKWLPGSMAIDLRDARLRPFYDRLAASRLPLIVHCGEEKAVPGAGREDLGNPLLLREPLRHGVRVVAAHCASLGMALDLERPRPRPVPAFDLFARLMDEPAWRGQLLGDVSAVFQFNRRAEVWQTLLRRQDWHDRLLHGSDYPLPGVGPLYRLGGLVRAGLLAEADRPVLEAVRAHNPLLFDLLLKRRVRWRGQRLADPVFATRRHFERGTAPA